MAFNDAFYANLLPAAQAYLAPQASMPEAVSSSSSDGYFPSPLLNPPPPPPVAEAPPPVAPPPPPPMTPTAPGPAGPQMSRPEPNRSVVPPMSFTSPSGPAPAAPPPAPSEPQAPSHPPVIMTPGAPAHEVLNAGPTRIALTNQAEDERLAGISVEADGQQKGALLSAMHATVARDEANAKAQGAQQAMADQAQKLDAARSKLQSFDAELEKNKPTDFWSDKTLGQRVGIALSVALVSGGQTLAGGNPALGAQMLNGFIEQDLKAKQARFGGVVARKDAAQAQFDNMAKQIGMAPASDMWQAAMKNKLAAEAEIRASSAKIPEVQAHAEKLALDLRAQADEHRADAFTKYVPKSGGSYMVNGIPIPIGANKAFDTLAGEQKEGREQVGKERIEGMKLIGKGEEHKGTNTRFIAEKMQGAGIPGTLASLDKAESYLFDDPKTGRKATTAGIGIMPSSVWESEKGGRVKRAAYGHIYGQDAVAREQAWAAAKSGALKTLSGVAVNPNELERFKQQADGAGDVDSRRRWLADVRQKITAERDNIFAGAGADATDEYKSNQAALKPKPIEEEPIQ